MLQPFHLAIPVHDIAAARAFYGKLFGCPEGRSAPSGNAIEFKAFKDPSRLFSK
jgi:extradiol dioxygenase family protein